MFHLRLRHITCFGHNINIGINRALDISRLEGTVKKLKTLQSAISHSWKKKRDMRKLKSFSKWMSQPFAALVQQGGRAL